MKIQIDVPEEVIEAIASRVIEKISHILNNRHDEVLTTEALAQYLKVDTSWVYKQVSQKKIPYFKAGKYIRFNKSDIDKWIKRKNTKPGL